MDSSVFFETRCNDFISVRKGLNNLPDLLVILKILNGKIPGRITASDIKITLYQGLKTVDSSLKLCSVVDMDMSCDMRILILINLNDSIEERSYTVSAAADSRHYRHSEEITQLLDIQLITLRYKLVMHI